MVSKRRSGSLSDFTSEQPMSNGTQMVINLWKREVFNEAMVGNMSAVRRALEENPLEFDTKELMLLKGAQTVHSGLEAAMHRIQRALTAPQIPSPRKQ